MNPRHLQIDSQSFDRVLLSSNKGGVKQQTSVSFYDIPTDLMVFRSEPDKHFVIRLSYPGGDESMVQKAITDHVILHTGATSGRIYEIHVDIQNVRTIGDVQLVSDALDDVRKALTKAISDARAATNRERHQHHGPESIRYTVNGRILREVKTKYVPRVMASEEQVCVE